MIKEKRKKQIQSTRSCSTYVTVEANYGTQVVVNMHVRKLGGYDVSLVTGDDS